MESIYNYGALDIETTSLYPNQGQTLEVGLVLDDLEQSIDSRLTLEDYLVRLPKLQIIIKHPYIYGDAAALAMHHRIFKILSEEKITSEEESVYWNQVNLLLNKEIDYIISRPEHVFRFMSYFLKKHGLLREEKKLVVAGKNLGTFDFRFLEKLPQLDEDDTAYFKFAHRVIDPGSMYLRRGDKIPPSLSECLQRAGVEKSVDHTAIGDCLDIIRVIKLSNLYVQS